MIFAVGFPAPCPASMAILINTGGSPQWLFLLIQVVLLLDIFAIGQQI